jgi:hypothetical protein
VGRARGSGQPQALRRGGRPPAFGRKPGTAGDRHRIGGAGASRPGHHRRADRLAGAAAPTQQARCRPGRPRAVLPGLPRGSELAWASRQDRSAHRAPDGCRRAGGRSGSQAADEGAPGRHDHGAGLAPARPAGRADRSRAVVTGGGGLTGALGAPMRDVPQRGRSGRSPQVWRCIYIWPGWPPAGPYVGLPTACPPGAAWLSQLSCRRAALP